MEYLCTKLWSVYVLHMLIACLKELIELLEYVYQFYLSTGLYPLNLIYKMSCIICCVPLNLHVIFFTAQNNNIFFLILEQYCL